jgi:hypothetical protein
LHDDARVEFHGRGVPGLDPALQLTFPGDCRRRFEPLHSEAMTLADASAVPFAELLGARGFASMTIIMPFPSEAGRTRAS